MPLVNHPRYSSSHVQHQRRATYRPPVTHPLLCCTNLSRSSSIIRDEANSPRVALLSDKGPGRQRTAVHQARRAQHRRGTQGITPSTATQRNFSGHSSKVEQLLGIGGLDKENNNRKGSCQPCQGELTSAVPRTSQFPQE
jgi:hypothetical protein